MTVNQVRKKPTSLWIVGVLLFLLLSACESNGSNSDTSNVLTEHLEKLKQANHVGGFAVALEKSDRMYQGAVGNSEEGVELSADMSMGIGGITQTFTATLIFKLIEKQKLSLKSSLGTLIPEHILGTPISTKVTVEQILTHSSGINDSLDQGLLEEILANSRNFIRKDEFVAPSPSSVPRGGVNQYSNPNYILLGLIIEKYSGMEYKDYLRQEIFNPLGIKSSYLITYEDLPEGVELGYSWLNGENQKNFSRASFESIVWSSGSIFASVADVAKFYRALFSGKIISKASLAKMITTRKGTLNTLNPRQVDFGYGIFKQVTKNKEVIYYHTGETIAYNSVAMYNQTTDTVAVVVANEPLDTQVLPDGTKYIGYNAEEIALTIINQMHQLLKVQIKLN